MEYLVKRKINSKTTTMAITATEEEAQAKLKQLTKATMVQAPTTLKFWIEEKK